MHIPKYDPVCFCNTGTNKDICFDHDSVDGMINLICEQFDQVAQLNVNVEEEYEYMDNSLKRVVFLRGTGGLLGRDQKRFPSLVLASSGYTCSSYLRLWLKNFSNFILA